MPPTQLSPHDIDVLRKIRDPESARSGPVLIDASLPRDPHITNPSDYERATYSERQTILHFHQLERNLAILHHTNHEAILKLQGEFGACITHLEDLISLFPKYASAYNNKAQALRRLYGESVLLETSEPVRGLFNMKAPGDGYITHAATTIVSNLDTAILLLSPRTPFAPISVQAAKTLSQAYTQRGALFYVTAKQMALNPGTKLRLDRGWTQEDLEEMASRDFAMGGRYGNEVARGLAVATNPTAKLCGNIVREALRIEIEGKGTL